jgi:hypothetical protein
MNSIKTYSAKFILYLFTFLLVQSCSMSDSNDYVGHWISDTDVWQIKITKITKDLYDLQYFNPENGELNPDISGEYSLKEDRIYHIIPSKPAKYGKGQYGLTVPISPPEPPKEVSFFLAEDGRLYTNNVFYVKQK